MAYEDYTSFSEVDPFTTWAQTTTRNTGTGIYRNASSWVYKDYGVNNFGDFEHWFDFNVTSYIGFPSNNVGVWGLTDTPSTASAFDGLRVELTSAGAVYKAYLTNTSPAYSFRITNLSPNTVYYAKVIRSGTDISFTLYPSGADRIADTNAVGSIAGTGNTTQYQYLMGGMSGNYAGSDFWDLYVENLALTPLAPPPLNWLTGWQYRKKINLVGQSGASTDYQVLLNVGEEPTNEFDDNFDDNSFDTDKWTKTVAGAGDVNDIIEQNQRLEMSVPSASAFVQADSGAVLNGDFDIQVDWDFSPLNTSTSQALLYFYIDIDNRFYMRRFYDGSHRIGSFGKSGGDTIIDTSIVDSTTSGKFRLTRQGSIITTYYDIGSGWVEMSSYSSFSTGTGVLSLHLSSSNSFPVASCYWDNFKINTGADFNVEGHSTDFPLTKNDGGDLRFTSDDGDTLLDFWVEEVTDTLGSKTAKIWIEVADNLDTDKDIYCYYGGNSGTSNYSNGEDTFPFFDDFEGGSLDAGKWTETGTVAVSSSEVNLDNNDGIFGLSSYGNGYAYRAKSKGDEQDITFVGGWYDGNNNFVIQNSDQSFPEDFDKFLFYSTKAGSREDDYNDNWNDFRNTYYIYEIQKISNSNIKYSQGVNSNSYTNSTYIPTNDLASFHKAFDSTQESTLTIDWSLVRKCIDTEPSFSSVDSEELFDVVDSDNIEISDEITFPNLKEVDDTVLLDDSIELTLLPLGEELEDIIEITDSIEIGIDTVYDINNDFRSSILVLEDIDNKINTAIRVISDSVNLFSTVNGNIEDIDNDVRTLGEKEYNMSNDIRTLASWQVPGDAGFQSLGKEYIKVYIGAVEQTDINIDSISITKIINGAHTASFELGRAYDSSKPAVESTVEIKYNDWVLYTGYVTEITPSSTPESIIINCQDNYWKNNRTKQYFFVGHKPTDNKEKYYNKISTALSAEYSWNPASIGNFVPQNMSLFGTSYSDNLSSLVTNAGNYGWYYEVDGSKKLWTAGSGDIIKLEKQSIGTNLKLFQVISHQFKDNISNIINKLRVQMGEKVIRNFNDTGGGKEYPAYIYETIQTNPTPDWDSQYERLAKNSSDGYGQDYYPPSQEANYKNVFTKFKLPFLDEELGSWTDRFPPQVEILLPWSLWWESSISEGILKEGFTIDYDNQKLIFSEPIYLVKKNDFGEADDIRAPNLTLRIWKKRYYSNTEDENDDPETDVSNPLMFFTEKMGDYPITVMDSLQLTNMSIQVGGSYKDDDGELVVVPSWDDTAFAKDNANWQLSATADKKVQGNIEITLDTACTYNIQLKNRIMIDGVMENPLNIQSISYDIGSFKVSIQLENGRYYKRTVSLPSHGE